MDHAAVYNFFVRIGNWILIFTLQQNITKYKNINNFLIVIFSIFTKKKNNKQKLYTNIIASVLRNGKIYIRHNNF